MVWEGWVVWVGSGVVSVGVRWFWGVMVGCNGGGDGCVQAGQYPAPPQAHSGDTAPGLAPLRRYLGKIHFELYCKVSPKLLYKNISIWVLPKLLHINI